MIPLFTSNDGEKSSDFGKSRDFKKNLDLDIFIMRALPPVGPFFRLDGVCH